MTFREPAVLLGLALLPVAVLAYASIQHRRKREAAAFGNPALLAGVVTARPGWRRHLPAGLLLLAAAALILAIARPQRSVAAPQRAATVVLVNDVSGSMRAEDVDPDRLTAAVESAKVLLDKTPDNFRLGLVTFSDYAQQIVAPTTDRGAVTGALERMVADGGTAMGDGLARGLASAQTPVPTQDGKGTRKLPAIIVLLSDGKNTLGAATRSRSRARPRRRASRSTRSRSAPTAARSCSRIRSASPSASPCRPTRRRCARSPRSPAAASSRPSARTTPSRSTAASARG